jgi:hypothetical protein
VNGENEGLNGVMGGYSGGFEGVIFRVQRGKNAAGGASDWIRRTMRSSPRQDATYDGKEATSRDVA